MTPNIGYARLMTDAAANGSRPQNCVVKAQDESKGF